eukprot:6049024-Pleurochrysis_carterae.AAC.1
MFADLSRGLGVAGLDVECDRRAAPCSAAVGWGAMLPYTQKIANDDHMEEDSKHILSIQKFSA